MTRLERLRAAQVVAVMRCASADELVWAGRALAAGGMTALEATLTTPDALQGLARLRSELPDDVMIGAGTVLRPGEARAAIAAGAEFIVSPVVSLAVMEAAKEGGALCLPGAYTPTEVWQAWEAGADVVKVFPATTLGPAYLKDLAGPFPALRLMPTGGVSPETIPAWFKAGAFAVGAGSALMDRSAIASRDSDALARLARLHLGAAG